MTATATGMMALLVCAAAHWLLVYVFGSQFGALLYLFSQRADTGTQGHVCLLPAGPAVAQQPGVFCILSHMLGATSLPGSCLPGRQER